jgi:hypothetical protein
MGIVDDVVLRFPWNFKITKKSLEHSLAVQIITGSPVLINDGYFVLHPIVQESIQDKNSLIWQMIKTGYLRIMARGFGKFGLDEMPIRMATDGKVRSFQELIEKPEWKQIQATLREVDDYLSPLGHIQPWPKFDASSGFLLFAERLLHESSSETVGISYVVKNQIFSDFLTMFLDSLSSDMRAPRTLWENLAVSLADRSDVTSRPKQFVRALMNLANEIYHYNMGVMLSADLGMTVSVETQASSAFDDLLVTPDVIVEELPSFPQINIPKVILTAIPSKLVEILEPNRPVFIARQRWLDYLEKPIDLAPIQLREAGIEYAHLLAEHLGAHVNYKESEGFVNFAVGKLTELPRDAIVGLAASAGAGVGLITGIPKLGAISAVATGYMVTRLQKNMLGNVTKKFKVIALKNQIIPPDLLLSSQKTVSKIISRRVPSAIEIDLSKARTMASRMRRFDQ